MANVRFNHKSRSSIIERKKIRSSNRGATVANPITKEFDLSKEQRMFIRKIRSSIKNDDFGLFRKLINEYPNLMDIRFYNLALIACVENSNVYFADYICQIFDNSNYSQAPLDFSYPINESIRNDDLDMFKFIISRDGKYLSLINDFSIDQMEQKEKSEIIEFLKENNIWLSERYEGAKLWEKIK